MSTFEFICTVVAWPCAILVPLFILAKFLPDWFHY
jgi:hypothetical protein